MLKAVTLYNENVLLFKNYFKYTHINMQEMFKVKINKIT